jgi:hypothetical protein
VQAAIVKHGELFHPDGLLPLRAVEEEHVRQAFLRRYIDAEGDKEKSADARRKAFSRAAKKAIADKIICGQKDDRDQAMLWFNRAQEVSP